MGCEMSRKLKQQYKLMSQSPSETTEAKEKSGQYKEKKGGGKHPVVSSDVSEGPFLSA